MGRFTDRGTAKLGVRLTPGSLSVIDNAVVAAIPNNHSILFELFMNINGCYSGMGDSYHLVFVDNASTEYLLIRFLNGSKRIGFWLLSAIGGWDQTSVIPYPALPRKNYYVACLLDRTNNRKKIYTCGGLAINDAIGGVNPTFNTPNNHLYLGAAGGPITIDAIDILIRMTTMSACPLDVDAAIARQFQRPMVLDSSLAAVAVIASQYDLTTDYWSTGNLLTLKDTGIAGGYPLTSSVNVAPLIREVERP